MIDNWTRPQRASVAFTATPWGISPQVRSKRCHRDIRHPAMRRCGNHHGAGVGRAESHGATHLRRLLSGDRYRQTLHSVRRAIRPVNVPVVDRPSPGGGLYFKFSKSANYQSQTAWIRCRIHRSEFLCMVPPQWIVRANGVTDWICCCRNEESLHRSVAPCYPQRKAVSPTGCNLKT